jgi:hypothetical protein
MTERDVRYSSQKAENDTTIWFLCGPRGEGREVWESFHSNRRPFGKDKCESARTKLAHISHRAHIARRTDASAWDFENIVNLRHKNSGKNSGSRQKMSKLAKNHGKT